MTYSLDVLGDDCYEGSNVLKNKFDIRDSKQLDIMERAATTLRIAKAFSEIQFCDVDFEFYKNLHKYIFGDIYEWAGECRKIDMSKKGTQFCKAKDINNRAERLFRRLSNNDYLKIYEGDEFINEFTELYCDLNYIHPFREGNGRTQRLFLNMLLIYIRKSLDFSEVDRDELMIATIRSVSGDVFMLRDIFRENIKDI